MSKGDFVGRLLFKNSLLTTISPMLHQISRRPKKSENNTLQGTLRIGARSHDMNSNFLVW